MKDNIESLITSALEDKAFPGCVFLVSNYGEIIFHEGFGYFEYSEKSKKVNKETIYDLASLTKVIVTVTSIMILKDRKEINLDKKVSGYLPEFKGDNKESVTIKNLLLHSSGLPSWKPLFEISRDKKDVLKNIYELPLEYVPGEKCEYSDLGFILLGEIIERITYQSLDEFCKENIFTPLKMNKTFFRPPKDIWKDIPPTEHCQWRGKIIQGEVQDENAYVMGGVSGHAGLFSNAIDISVFCQVIMNEGYYNQTRLIQTDTIREFTKRVENHCEWALGWRMFMENDDITGSLFSKQSFGHLGYTGTSIWIEPVKEIFIILLSNRVHPTRENKKISEFRPRLHDEILKTLNYKV